MGELAHTPHPGGSYRAMWFTSPKTTSQRRHGSGWSLSSRQSTPSPWAESSRQTVRHVSTFKYPGDVAIYSTGGAKKPRRRTSRRREEETSLRGGRTSSSGGAASINPSVRGECWGRDVLGRRRQRRQRPMNDNTPTNAEQRQPERRARGEQTNLSTTRMYQKSALVRLSGDTGPIEGAA